MSGFRTRFAAKAYIIRGFTVFIGHRQMAVYDEKHIILCPLFELSAVCSERLKILNTYEADKRMFL